MQICRPCWQFYAQFPKIFRSKFEKVYKSINSSNFFSPKYTFENQFWEHQFLSKIVLTVLKAGLTSYAANVFHYRTFIIEPFLTHRRRKIPQYCCASCVIFSCKISKKWICWKILTFFAYFSNFLWYKFLQISFWNLSHVVGVSKV